MADRDPYILRRLVELKHADLVLAASRQRTTSPFAGARHCAGRLLVTIGVALVGDGQSERASPRPAGAAR